MGIHRGVKMKKLLLGSAALVALGLGAPAALAADRAVPAYTPPPPPVPVYTWTGCYAGANAGTSTGRSQQTTLGKDRKSTRLNSSHLVISYAVFCLKKKKNNRTTS